MTELIWINGEVRPLAGAVVSVEDRGFQFADGVYEVARVYGEVPFALDRHLRRLERSAAGIRLNVPLESAALGGEIGSLVRRSELVEGMIYLQLTRGEMRRSHAFVPSAAGKPTLLFYTRLLPPVP